MAASRIRLLAAAALTTVVFSACGDPVSPTTFDDARVAAGPKAADLGVTAYEISDLDAGLVLLLGTEDVVGSAEVELSSGSVAITSVPAWTPRQYRAVVTDLRAAVLGHSPPAPATSTDAWSAPAGISEVPPSCTYLGDGWDYCATEEGWCMSQGPSAGYCYYCGTWDSDEIEVGHAC